MSFICSWVLVEGSLDSVFGLGAPQQAAQSPAVFTPVPGSVLTGPCEFFLDLDEAVLLPPTMRMHLHTQWVRVLLQLACMQGSCGLRHVQHAGLRKYIGLCSSGLSSRCSSPHSLSLRGSPRRQMGHACKLHAMPACASSTFWTSTRQRPTNLHTQVPSSILILPA